MPRRKLNHRLHVLHNEAIVGILEKDSGGGLSFTYEASWINQPDAVPVSLSLPLQPAAFRGSVVYNVFDNLLPDSEALRRVVAERLGADGTDAFSLLYQIGRDCVGALQFVQEHQPRPKAKPRLTGDPLDEAEIESHLKRLVKTPLGVDAETDFRISIAGAQEKTALLRIDKQWLRPRGATPTSHILKTQIGRLQNGIDLSNSVENEYFCLKLLAAFGLPVAEAEIQTFGLTTVLVVKRFDRQWINPKRLIRLPQEDCCQALSIPSTKKYQPEGGPGIIQILELLKASDNPRQDQITFLKTQILFWLIGATDGHAKNFSIFLGPHGRFRLTPIYDVLSAQPSLKQRQIEPKQMRLAMFVGDNRHYRLEEIQARHFIQSVQRARLPKSIAEDALNQIMAVAATAIEKVEHQLPDKFPAQVSAPILQGLRTRLSRI